MDDGIFAGNVVPPHSTVNYEFDALAVDELTDAVSQIDTAHSSQNQPLQSIDELDQLDQVDGISSPRSQPETSRPRAHELTSSLKVIPHIDHTFRDSRGFVAELDAFFALVPELDEFVHDLAADAQQIDVGAALNDLPDSAPGLLYHALGAYASTATLSEHEKHLRANTQSLLDAGLLDSLPLPTTNIHVLGLWAVAILVGEKSVADTIHRRKVLQFIIKDLSGCRWDDVTQLKLVGARIALARLIVLCIFGSEPDKVQATKYNYEYYGLNDDNKTHDLKTTPEEYEAFRHSVLLRYPAYIPPDSVAPQSAKTGMFSGPEARRRQMLPSLSIPEVPASIEEACQLFRSRIQTTPDIIQMWKEHESFVRTGLYFETKIQENGDTDANLPPSLARVQDVYSDTLLYIKSFLTVVANYILQEDIIEEEPTGIHAAVTMIKLLLEWYKLSHILKHEFLCAILFDLQYHLITFKFCARNPILGTVLMQPPQEKQFWLVTKAESLGKQMTEEDYGLEEPKPSLPIKQAPTEGVRIDRFTPDLLECFISLVNITRTIITDKTQRIIIVAELPADALKQLMAVYNNDLWQQVLHIFKLQTPFNGKKWRYMNMELISAIYLHCESKLNDEWLAGADVVNEIKAASSQEEALREMIELYNTRIRAVSIY